MLGSVKSPFKLRTPGLACTWGVVIISRPTSCSHLPGLPHAPLPGRARQEPGLQAQSSSEQRISLLTPPARCEGKPLRSSVKLLFSLLLSPPLWRLLAQTNHLGVSPSLIPSPAAVQPEGDVSLAQTSGRTDWSSICMAWNVRN